MHTGVGVALISSAAVLSLAVGFVLRRRTPPRVAIGLAALGGVGLAAGALLVQSRASVADWVVAVAAMALLWPLHIRVVLGPFGLKDGRLLAEDAPGA